MQEAPIRSLLPVVDGERKEIKFFSTWPRPWANWFLRLTNAIGWSFALTATKVIDFGPIPAASEASSTVTVTGAATTNTPNVLVTPSANTAGINYTGVVTAANTVTIYAKNFTAGPIDPASTTFRVTVLQP